jgi:hypothetical protein
MERTKKKRQKVIPIMELIRLNADTFWVTMTASLLCSACLLLSWAPPFTTPPFSELLRQERGTSIYLLPLMFCASNDMYSTVTKDRQWYRCLSFYISGTNGRTQTYVHCTCLLTVNRPSFDGHSCPVNGTLQFLLKCLWKIAKYIF